MWSTWPGLEHEVPVYDVYDHFSLFLWQHWWIHVFLVSLEWRWPQDWERFEDQNLELFYERFNRRRRWVGGSQDGAARMVHEIRSERSCNKSEYVIPSIVDDLNPIICNSSHCYEYIYIIYYSLDEITYRMILGTCSKICGIQVSTYSHVEETGQAYGGCLFQRTDVIHTCYDSWWIIHHYPYICIYKL
jgi:hypothetical protein